MIEEVRYLKRCVKGNAEDREDNIVIDTSTISVLTDIFDADDWNGDDVFQGDAVFLSESGEAFIVEFDYRVKIPDTNYNGGAYLSDDDEYTFYIYNKTNRRQHVPCKAIRNIDALREHIEDALQEISDDWITEYFK